MSTFRNITIEYDANGVATGRCKSAGVLGTIATTILDPIQATGVTMWIAYPAVDINDDASNDSLKADPATEGDGSIDSGITVTASGDF